MSYWRGVLAAVAFDVAWIVASPSLVIGPERPLGREPHWVMNPEPGVSYMQTSPEDAQLNEAGRLEDSLMVYLQSHEDDTAAMVNLARMYIEHGWYDAAVGPLARALQLDAGRRAGWSLLDRALKQSGKAQITDAELTRRAQQFVEAVKYWGHGC
jgi:predicted Zn-dependent protease